MTHYFQLHIFDNEIEEYVPLPIPAFKTKDEALAEARRRIDADVNANDEDYQIREFISVGLIDSKGVLFAVSVPGMEDYCGGPSLPH
ncbi:hypothetical protein ISM37_004508 [Salmonella enterica]|nr:hypothetical protein [Salmonella enterica]EGN7527251.1 hypothetical protein [Salmonella enterica]EGO6832871.1 hypothetical protein [Salmonella enterica]EGO6840258.1 hypothetical protein [Salmonella enterica]EGO6860187.1 hypothetical protein [Salmonella enterica]